LGESGSGLPVVAAGGGRWRGGARRGRCAPRQARRRPQFTCDRMVAVRVTGDGHPEAEARAGRSC